MVLRVLYTSHGPQGVHAPHGVPQGVHAPHGVPQGVLLASHGPQGVLLASHGPRSGTVLGIPQGGTVLGIPQGVGNSAQSVPLPPWFFGRMWHREASLDHPFHCWTLLSAPLFITF